MYFPSNVLIHISGSFPAYFLSEARSQVAGVRLTLGHLRPAQHHWLLLLRLDSSN
jgi:hypothetical protein